MSETNPFSEEIVLNVIEESQVSEDGVDWPSHYSILIRCCIEIGVSYWDATHQQQFSDVIEELKKEGRIGVRSPIIDDDRYYYVIPARKSTTSLNDS